MSSINIRPFFGQECHCCRYLNLKYFSTHQYYNRGTQRICSSHYLFPRGILLAGKNTGVSMSWLGNFVIERGFAWELLTVSSISTRAGCRNSEDGGRLKKKKKKIPSLSQRVVTNIRRLVRVIALAEKTCFVPVLSLLFGRFGSRDLKARGIPGWEIHLISWLGNQPILSSWLGNFLCVLLGKRHPASRASFCLFLY